MDVDGADTGDGDGDGEAPRTTAVHVAGTGGRLEEQQLVSAHSKQGQSQTASAGAAGRQLGQYSFWWQTNTQQQELQQQEQEQQ